MEKQKKRDIAFNELRQAIFNSTATTQEKIKILDSLTNYIKSL